MEYNQIAPSCQRNHSGVTCGPRALTVPTRQVTSLCRNSSISSRLMAIRLPRRCVCNCCSLIVSTLAVPLRVTPTSRLDHVAAGSGIRLWAEQSLTEQHRLIAGRYRLLEHVGRGAMGIVWRAHDESLDRPVAVKEFVYTDTDGTNGADATSERHRVMREGRIAARLQHPHAVNVYNVVEDDGRPWLIMEYQSSRSLADVIAERGPLQPAEVVSIGRQLAAALTAAHAAGIVHRDVKPGNVLVAADGTAKLTDFGISHAVGGGTMTTTREIAGTPAFFAPEVARGEQATFASDVFSLGSTLYNAVEGAPPFPHSDNQIALLYRVATGEVRPAGRAGVLAPVLRQLLQSDPAFRPDTNAARAALTTVEREQQQPPRGPTTMATPINAAATPSRGRATKVAIGAIVLLAATTVTLILGFTPGSDDNRSAA